MSTIVEPPNSPAPLTKKDFETDQEVRWCPGCGDYAILASVQNTFPKLGIPKEKFVIVSGIGCSSRFPYYMNTFGFHGIHGRAPAIATGVKLANPELSVWVVTGDGDAMSIGGNHLIHSMRRNIDIKLLMFNNRIYGLTKGQASPTSELGKKTKSSPYGTAEEPFNPISVALGANARFVARAVDVMAPHLRSVLEAAAQHRGSAFIEILQNCNIFNDGAWEPWTEKSVRDDRVLLLEQGKPLVFGKEHKKGIRLRGLDLEIVDFDGDPPADLIIWDAERTDPTLAMMIAAMGDREGFPMPIGVFKNIRVPSFEERVHAQLDAAIAQRGPGKLESLVGSGETWDVK